jgi:hypothetical protein
MALDDQHPLTFETVHRRGEVVGKNGRRGLRGIHKLLGLGIDREGSRFGSNICEPLFFLAFSH